MSIRMVERLVLLAAVVGLAVACEDDGNITDPTRTVDGSIVHGDTTLLTGESATISSQAVYGLGPGLPIDVIWGQGDSSVIGVTALPNGEVQVSARAAGSSILVARINTDFLDTITVTVVDTGAVRWRRTVATGAGLHGWDLAVDDSGRVATTDGQGQMILFGTAGDTLWRFPGACDDLTGPALTGLGVWSSGTNCTSRFALDGTQVFSVGVGGPDERMAIAANGDVVVLARLAPDSVLALTRYDFTGGLLWRDTLRTGAIVAANPRGGVAIAGNGDIYVTWSFAPSADSAFVSRYSSGGVLRWEQALSADPHETAPAVVGTRVYVVHRAGVAVRDSAGAVVYDRPFTDIFPGGAAMQSATSPVIDAAGNLYAQSEVGLFSLDATGVVRWAADSLPRGNQYNSGPVVLQGGNQMVILCGLRACGVNPGTGVVTWRGPQIATTAANYGGLAAAPGGGLYVMVDNEVVALWHRRIMAVSGWPTLGGNRGRSGTAP